MDRIAGAMDADRGPLDEGFRPFFALRGAFRQSVAAAFLPARYPPDVPTPLRQEIVVPSRQGPERLGVLLTPAPPAPVVCRGRLVLFHGLGGNASSRYMIRTAVVAHRRGWSVARVSFRGSEADRPGGTSLHNAGRSEDVAAAAAQIVWDDASRDAPLAAIGFSLGGAVVLRHLGESGPRTSYAAAASIGAPLVLGPALESLEQRRNWLYHRYYVHRMRVAMRGKIAAHPERLPPLTRRMNTVRALDTVYTAPDAGYESAEAYYEACSAMPLLRRIDRPCLLMTARDDPFIDPATYERAEQGLGPCVRVAILGAGGHVGFLERQGLGVGSWASRALVAWLETMLSGSC